MLYETIITCPSCYEELNIITDTALVSGVTENQPASTTINYKTKDYADVVDEICNKAWESLCTSY